MAIPVDMSRAYILEARVHLRPTFHEFDKHPNLFTRVEMDTAATARDRRVERRHIAQVQIVVANSVELRAAKRADVGINVMHRHVPLGFQYFLEHGSLIVGRLDKFDQGVGAETERGLKAVLGWRAAISALAELGNVGQDVEWSRLEALGPA